MNTDNNYKIEKGIPVPLSHNGKWGKWVTLGKSMEDGDSVLVKDHIEAIALRSALVRLGCKCVTRKTGYQSEMRVWKIKK